MEILDVIGDGDAILDRPTTVPGHPSFIRMDNGPEMTRYAID